MIKSNFNLSECDQENTLECRLYTLIALMIIMKVITTFIQLINQISNSTLKDHESV